MPDDPLAAARVVLSEPQDPVNIAATVRAMKNMGVEDLRLVAPKAYDASRIEAVAHGTSDIVSRIRHHETLDEALADCVRVAGFTARHRTAKRNVVDPAHAARDLVRFAADGPVALLFGREDKGLPNEALDRAHLVVTIPTTEHASLNLAQAVLIGLYELHRASPGATRELPAARKDAPAATAEQYERLFSDVHRALDALDFFRTRNPELILRTGRSLAYRAEPDAREIELVRAMAIEVVRALDRARSRT